MSKLLHYWSLSLYTEANISEKTLAESDWLDSTSTPNSTFMSTSVQFCVAHARSRISNTASVVFDRTSSSTAVIVTPDRVMPAATIWSSLHWGSWFASSFNISAPTHRQSITKYYTATSKYSTCCANINHTILQPCFNSLTTSKYSTLW